jgi:hypothetical protein
MATYVNDLRLKEIATGDESGTWGTSTNTNLELIAEAFSFGTEAITTNADTHTTTIADGSTDPGRSLFLKYTGTLDSTCTITIGPNTVSKLWFIQNSTSGSQSIIISQGSGANITIPTGQTKAVYSDGAGSGAAIVDAFQDLSIPDLFVDDDLTVGDDLLLLSDAAALKFGADSDVTLTHVADTGLLLNSTMAIQFNDASQFINAPSATILDVNATDEIELNATLVDVNANLDVSGTYTGAGLMTTGGNIVVPDAGNIGSASDTDAIAIGADGDVTLTQDLELKHDGAILSFGADDDTTLTHTDGSGLTLNSTNKIMFNDASQFIQGSSATVLALGATDEIDLTATAVDVNGTMDVSGALTQSTAAVKVAGVETIYVPAAAMYPNSTNGCADLTQVELSNGPEIKCLDFDASSDENAQFTVCFPKSWNEGTVTFQAFWTVTGTNTGTVAWGLSGVCIADDASINTAFGTNVVATAKAFSGTSNDMTVSAVSGAVTISNAAVDTQTYFQIMRDVSADSQSGDARLLGIKLFFTTDAKNDS